MAWLSEAKVTGALELNSRPAPGADATTSRVGKVKRAAGRTVDVETLEFAATAGELFEMFEVEPSRAGVSVAFMPASSSRARNSSASTRERSDDDQFQAISCFVVADLRILADRLTNLFGILFRVGSRSQAGGLDLVRVDIFRSRRRREQARLESHARNFQRH